MCKTGTSQERVFEGSSSLDFKKICDFCSKQRNFSLPNMKYDDTNVHVRKIISAKSRGVGTERRPCVTHTQRTAVARSESKADVDIKGVALEEEARARAMGCSDAYN